MPLVPVPKPTFAQKLKRFFMIDLLKGMAVTLGFNVGALTDKDAVAGKGIYTEQYPKVRPDVAPRFHGAPRLNMDPETHETLCIACNLCALACPEDCIDVIPMDVEVVVADFDWLHLRQSDRRSACAFGYVRWCKLPGSVSR
jgi:formate hydrogenlyase subunit 6/NADH:ubiquinone oxidoreductase subunit I